MLEKAKKLLTGKNLMIMGVILVILVVASGLVFPFIKDMRFMIYYPETFAGNNPFDLLGKSIEEIGQYLDAGNFRPISRAIIFVVYWLVFKVSSAINIPPHILFAIAKITALGLLYHSMVRIIRQYRYASKSDDVLWKNITVMFTIAFSSLAVIHSVYQHPLTLFPFLYLGTTAFTFYVAHWAGNKVPKKRLHTVNKWHFITALLLGTAAASMIELAYLVIPIVLANIYLLTRVGSKKPVNLLTFIKTRAFKLWAMMTIGFLLVFLPTRYLISQSCIDTGCYNASSITLNSKTTDVLRGRIVSPIVTYSKRTGDLFNGDLKVSAGSFAVLAIVLSLGAAILNKLQVSEGLRNSKGKSNVRYLVFLALTVVLLASFMISLSARMQAAGYTTTPWRDTAYLWPAWAMIIGIFLAWPFSVLDASKARIYRLIISVFALLTLIVPTIANTHTTYIASNNDEIQIHTEIGYNLTYFRGDSDANDYRCGLFDRLNEVRPDITFVGERVKTYLNQISLNQYGTVYCNR